MNTMQSLKYKVAFMFCCSFGTVVFAQTGGKELNNRVEVLMDKETVIQNSDKTEYVPVLKRQFTQRKVHFKHTR